MDIQLATRDYALCISNDTITEPTGGTWVSAAAIYLGATEPVNGSWIQALCAQLGVTQPLYGSWVIALANHYGVTQPLNGSWWFGIANEACNGLSLAPIANFTSDFTSIEEGDSVQFTDTSTVPAGGSAITDWQWAFTGGSPGSYVGQNPQKVQYNTAGQYEVSLSATNTEGTGTKTVPNYITVLAALVWNTTDTDWNLEDTNWATDTTAPAAPVWSSFTTTNDPQPTVNGTAEANSTITFVINAVTYTTTTNGQGDWTININQDLPGSVSPGTDYLGSCTATDGAGNTSAATTATITSLVTVQVYEFVMTDSYGDGWNNGWSILQKESSPGSGVWTDVNFNGNPYRFRNTTDAQLDQNREYYITNAFTTLITYSGSAGLRFERYDADDPSFPAGGSTAWKGPVSRFLDVTPGESYRVISGEKGNYENERTWKLYDNNGTLLFTKTGSANWNPGDVQYTFTA